MNLIISPVCDGKYYATFDGNEYRCAIGENGITTNKLEGDGATPAGKFKITKLLYRKDRISGLHSKIPTGHIRPSMGWCDEPRDSRYNQQVKLPYKCSHEVLYRDDEIYDIIGITNHNSNPVRAAAGSAIFIHLIRRAGYYPTRGCIAFREQHLREIVSQWDPDQDWLVIV